jgi:hypothetical protein
MRVSEKEQCSGKTIGCRKPERAFARTAGAYVFLDRPASINYRRALTGNPEKCLIFPENQEVVLVKPEGFA